MNKSTSRGLFTREIELVRKLMNSKYKDILIILQEHSNKQKDKPNLLDLTISDVNNKLEKGNYRITWRYIKLLTSIKFVKAYNDGNKKRIKLVEGEEANQVSEELLKLNTKSFVDKVSSVVSKEDFKKKVHDRVDKVFE